MATKFGSLRLLFAGFVVWNLLYVTLLGPRILSLLLNSWKIYVPYSIQYKSYVWLYECEAPDKLTKIIFKWPVVTAYLNLQKGCIIKL